MGQDPSFVPNDLGQSSDSSDHDLTIEDAAIIESIERGLRSHWSRDVTVDALRREVHRHATSFHVERLSVLANGRWTGMILKDLHTAHQVRRARFLPRSERMSAFRELILYRDLFNGRDFGVPVLYGHRWDPAAGQYWLILEEAGQWSLEEIHNPDLCLWAAKWVARLHAAVADPPPSVRPHLYEFDAAHYLRCAERIEAKLEVFTPSEREVIEAGLDRYRASIPALTALPRSLIHGEFYECNLVARDRSDDHPLAVIDWESAAYGPSYLDIASLTAESWSAEEKLATRRAYFEEYCGLLGVGLDWDYFVASLSCLELHQALWWLGWWSDLPHFSRYVGWLLRPIESALAASPK